MIISRTINDYASSKKNARIGYGNLLTSTSSGAEALLEPNTYNRWVDTSGSSTTLVFYPNTSTNINYVAIAGHTFGTQDNGVPFTVSYATSVGGAREDIAYIDPQDNSPIWIEVDTLEVAEIAITFDAITAGLEIAVVQAGIYMEMQRPLWGGHTPIDLSAKTEYIDAFTETGNFIGRAIKKRGLVTDFSWRNLQPEWVRNTFKGFMVHAREFPFFIVWRPDVYETCAYGSISEDIRPSNQDGGTRLMSVGFKVRAHDDL